MPSQPAETPHLPIGRKSRSRRQPINQQRVLATLAETIETWWPAIEVFLTTGQTSARTRRGTIQQSGRVGGKRLEGNVLTGSR